MNPFLLQYDLFIAFGLIGITIILFLIYRMHILPNKSLPYVAFALVGVFGFSIIKKWKSDKLKTELKNLEKELNKKEEKLKQLKKTYETSDKKLHEMEAELEHHRTAYKKQILFINAKNKEEKERIGSLEGKEVFDEFRKAIFNQ